MSQLEITLLVFGSMVFGWLLCYIQFCPPWRAPVKQPNGEP